MIRFFRTLGKMFEGSTRDLLAGTLFNSVAKNGSPTAAITRFPWARSLRRLSPSWKRSEPCYGGAPLGALRLEDEFESGQCGASKAIES